MKGLRMLMQSRVCHLHFSSPPTMFAGVLLAKMARRRVMLTVHGDLSGAVFNESFLLRSAIRLADIPIMINESSFQLGKRLNSNARKIGAFIPPLAMEELPSDVVEEIRSRAAQCRLVVVSNASRYAIDANGREIYGIFALADYCKEIGALLIVSDPSGSYESEFSRRYGNQRPENVFMMSAPHEFSAILAFADIFVRNTTTDGDSLSVHEALSAEVATWATNVVERPPGVRVFESLLEIDLNASKQKYRAPIDTVGSLVQVYLAEMVGVGLRRNVS